MKKILRTGLYVFAGLIILGAIGSVMDDEETIVEGTLTEQPMVEEVSKAKQYETIVQVQEEKPEPVSKPVEEKASLTMGQKNAVRAAEKYLNIMSFSRSGLIEQLEYEGFSSEDAAFAMDNITVNWNEQATKTAEKYLNLMSFSRQGLIEQLEYEGFTSEQANYGVSQVGY